MAGSSFQQGFTGPPTYPAAVYGIRSWNLTPGDTYPRGDFSGYWPLPTKRARCRINDNATLASRVVSAAKVTFGPEEPRPAACPSAQVPNRNCTCGIYAYFSERSLPFSYQRTRHGQNARITFQGVVEGSGKTLIGPNGFRTAMAKVVAITFGSRGGEDIWRGWTFLGSSFDGQLYAVSPAVEVQSPRQHLDDLGRLWDVPVFESQSAMLREFPLTDPVRDFPGLMEKE